MSASTHDPPPKAVRRAVFGFVINGFESGEVTATLDRDDILLPLSDLTRAGIALPPGVSANPDGLVAVSRLAPHVTARLDENTLALNLDVGADLLGTHRLDLRPRPPEGLERPRDTSAFLNYGLSVDTTGVLLATGEFGLRLGDTLTTTTVSGRTGEGVVRGLTQVLIDDRDDLVRWTIGEAFTSTGNLGGSAFLAGLAVGRELSLDPYFVQSPGVSFEGSMPTPGTVDVYVGGTLVQRVPVPAGTFRLEDLPTPQVAGEVRYELRDAFGTVRSYTRPYSVSSEALRPGLHTYTYGIGVERRSLGTDSFEYGAPMALGRHRVGLSHGVTLGWRGEVAPTRELYSAGIDTTLSYGDGQFDAGVHGSVYEGEPGLAVSLGWQYPGRVVSASLYGIYRTREYATVSTPWLPAANTADLGGRVSFFFSDWQFGIEGRYSRRSSLEDELSGRASLSWVLAPGVQLQLAGGVAHSPTSSAFDVAAFLDLSPWRCCSASIGERITNAGAETTLGFGVPIQGDAGLGVQASAALGDRVSVLLRPEAQTAEGRYQASLSIADRTVIGSFDVNGAVGFVSGAGLALLRPVVNAFAIARVPEGVEVKVLREGREVGSTRSGRLVVQDLIPHYANRVAVSADELTLDYEVHKTERLVAPAYRSGVGLTFDIVPTRYVRGRVIFIVAPGVDPATVFEGEPAPPLVSSDDGRERGIIPSWGRIFVAVGERLVTSPLGRRAEFELRDLPAGRHRGVVQFRGRRCTVWLTVARSAPGIEETGVSWCRPEEGER